MKRLLTLGLLLVSTASMAQTTVPNRPSDLPAGHWAAPAVENLYRLGILRGYPDGTFKGSRPVSRFELASVLDAFMAERQAVVRTLSDRISGLSPQRTDLGENAAQLGRLRAQLDTLRADVAVLRTQAEDVKGLNESFSDLGEKLKKLRGEVDALRGDLGKTGGRIGGR